MTYSLLATPDRLTFVNPDGGQTTVRVSGRLRANGGPAIREALLAAHGLTLLPASYAEPDIASGDLRAVLQAYRVKPSALYAVFAHREHLPAKVRLFIEALAAHLARHQPGQADDR